jgi:hypothetical protein
VPENILTKIEKISNESKSVIVLYQILRIIDMILKNKLVTFENKETSNLIYFINNIFLLHDILVGSAVSKRIAQRSKSILQYVLKRSIYYLIIFNI